MEYNFFSVFQILLGFFGVLLLLFIFLSLIALILKRKKSPQEIKVEIKKINDLYKKNKNKILQEILTENEYKNLIKNEKKELKKRNKESLKKVFVIDFVGDVAASSISTFREQITTLLQVATPDDEIMVRLESPGGMVHAYGLAASQLARIREKNIYLTICVDKVAASGGYMMACLGNQILSAPFAIIGSIGVVANIPNLHRLLKKKEVDYLEMTAGEYKRTLSLFGEVTEKGKSKFQEQMNETHELFKEHIKKYRKFLDIDSIATGEFWFGIKAHELKLVDELKTSDDYLMEKINSYDVYLLSSPKKESLKEKLGHLFGAIDLFYKNKEIESQNIPF